MKRYILMAGLVAGCIIPGISARLTPEQALSRFRDTDRQRVAGNNRISEPKLQATIGSLYIFQDNAGFIILPDDDAAPSLLGYSDSSEFDIEKNPSLKYWLDFYNSELDYLHSHHAGKSVEVSKRSADRELIEPLIKTKWNQESPYNGMCPKVDGRGVVTGCVATAMAQALKYYNYPDHGKGEHSYFWRPGEEELSFNYEETQFKWDLMDNIYDSKSSEESKQAVAELMLACGISVDMHYEPGESGAATSTMGEALINIFDYSPSLWMPNRTYYGYDEWENMIYSDLAKGMPVLYSGAGTDGGHQFICDGYGGNGFFHINWGWGGMSNGYFLLTALNPADLGVGGGAGGFNTSQVATLGFRLPQAGDEPMYVVYNSHEFTTDMKSVKSGDDFIASGIYFNYSLFTLPEGSKMGLKFSTPDGETVKYADGPDMDGYRMYDGRENIRIKFPELPDGSYIITPALFAGGKWSDVKMPVGYSASISVTVESNEGTLKNDNGAVVSISDIDAPETIYKGKDFPMPFTIKNDTEVEYYGSVTPLLRNSKGEVVAKSKFRPVDILPGETTTISDYVGNFSAEKDKELTADEYSLIFINEAGREISSPITVNVEIMTEETKIRATDFGLKEDHKGDHKVTDPTEVVFTFNLNCVSGVFYGTPSIVFFPGDGGYELERANGEPVYLTSGENKVIEITADLEKFENGHYIAGVYDGGREISETLYFSIDRKDGVSMIEGIDPESVKIYDLNGVERKEPLTKGIYIINGRKVLVAD